MCALLTPLPVPVSRFPASDKSIQFRTLPYTAKAGNIVADRINFTRSGYSKQAIIHNGGLGKNTGYAWACEYFTLRVIPPPTFDDNLPASPRKHSVSESPFPDTPARKSKAELESPAPVTAIFKALREHDPTSLTPEENRSIDNHAYTMNLTIPISKKVHKLATVRSQTRQRITGAIRLAVQQGIEPDGEGGYVQDLNDRGFNRWLLPHHQYVIHANLGCFRLTLPDLLLRIRLALKATRVSFLKCSEQACEWFHAENLLRPQKLGVQARMDTTADLEANRWPDPPVEPESESQEGAHLGA